MRVLRVARHAGSTDAIFKFNRFITDWSTAQQIFIEKISDNFRDFCPIKPHDFSVTQAYSLGDLRCKCLLFGGVCTIFLAPDSAQMSFINLKKSDASIIHDVIRRFETHVLSEFSHERESFWHQESWHLNLLSDDSIDSYLNQFKNNDIENTVTSNGKFNLIPSIRIVLSDEESMCRFHYVIERSLSGENQLFMDTWGQFLSPDNMSFDDRLKVLDQLHRIAHRAVGLAFEENSG